MVSVRDMLIRATEFAVNSPDPSTQNGAALYSPGAEFVIAVDCNAFPEGVKYLDERWERPIKYSFIEHAERNVIYKAAKMGASLDGAVMASPWAACADCARAIIQSGLSTLFRLSNEHNTNARWDDSCSIGDIMLREAGIEIVDYTEQLGTVKLLRDGVLISP